MAETAGGQPHPGTRWRMWLRFRSERQAGIVVGPRQLGGEQLWV